MCSRLNQNKIQKWYNEKEPRYRNSQGELSSMQKHPEITRNRLRSFIHRGKMQARLYPRHAAVALSVFSAKDRISFPEAMLGNYRETHIGEQFGPLWSTHWFKLGIEIPKDWHSSEVHLRWDSSSEACVWKDGVPLQGLTGTGHPTEEELPVRTEYVISRQANGGEKLTLYVEVACNHLIASEDKSEIIGKLRMAEIAEFDRRAWDLLWDLITVAEMALHLPNNTPRAAQALYAANEMLNKLDLADPATWSASREVAAKYLGTANGGGQHTIHAIGHGHLDTAWLWPLAETKRKCYRTFSTALQYMDSYPEYKFASSQAQQYEWMKQEQPALYAKILQRVSEDRFIPVGGTWVEPDCNIPSGESLVRQFLLGQEFFKKEFGITCQEFWNPDVFGYNGQLPQIMRGAGIKYFVTQKLCFNQFNKPQHQTFWWEGIDGSKILTHFPPADTYSGNCTIKQLAFNVENYKDLDRSNESLYLFGYGDGGGGPTMEMLERLRRVRDVEGLPRVQIRAPHESLLRIEAEAKEFVTHVGELYFEDHRGTYTTQAKNKLYNRRCEELLHDVEFLSAMATDPYPRAELAHLWKLLLLNQFHDIIPGSSIAEVYRDSEKDYEEILSTGTKLREKAIKNLDFKSADNCEVRSPVKMKLPKEHAEAVNSNGSFKAGKNLVAINTLGSARSEVVELPGTEKELGIVTAPALGYAVQKAVTTVEIPATVNETAQAIVLENRFVRAIFNRDGTLVNLTDKRVNREIIAGNANRFVMFRDEPYCYDAWNVEAYHLEKRIEVEGALSVRINENSPLRCSVEFQYEITPHSKLSQTVSLTAVSPRLDFSCKVDWHEHEKFLKVEFPTNIRSDHAAYEIQFGHLNRPTHFNTSYDLAKFEVCAQRWVDLAEPGFGMALLNDCKYGYAVHGGTMRLSLLRSPKYPDPDADKGLHSFQYALLPHIGSLQDAGVVHEAQRFNSPLILRNTDAEHGEKSWFHSESSNVVIDTVKKAEDSDAIIVRLYEAGGNRTHACLRSMLPVKSAIKCNLLENEEGALEWNNGSLNFELEPFQIVTMKLCLQG
jgi:alpha-mannosidase